MDNTDPWDWNVDRVVREFCSPHRTWTPSSDSPKLPLPQQLEASLREHEADGHTILTYPDEAELCNELSIRSLKHKATFRHALSQLRLRSQKYQNNQNKVSAPTTTSTPTLSLVATEHLSADEPARKRRRTTSTVILDKEKDNTDIHLQGTIAERIERQEPERRRVQPHLAAVRCQPAEPNRPTSQYFRDAGLSNYDILCHDDTDSATQQDICEFAFDSSSVTVYRGHQIQVHRMLYRALKNIPHTRRCGKRPADSVAPLNDPFDDEVLPVYGESDQEYDSETWNEIQEEQRERRSQQARPGCLTAGKINAILDTIIQRYEAKWWEEKKAGLRYKAPQTWDSIQKSRQQYIRMRSRDLQRLDKRIAALRGEIATANLWYAENDLVHVAASLEPSIRDRLETKWLLDLANQKHKPEEAAALPPQRGKRAAGPDPYEDVDITDTGEDLTSEPGDMMPLAQYENESPAITASQSEHITSQTSASSRHEVIVISSDSESESDTTSPASTVRNATRLDDDADEEDSREQVEEIGRQFANRSISTRDWKSLCRLFQCPEDITEHKPAGFKLIISGYQLHAIWWQLTQYPVRGVPGGCLGDEMGLGKTIEVIATFAVFAIIKTNYIEVQNYWENGITIDGREHLPRNQNKTDAACPGQHLSLSGLLCPCVKSGEAYLVATKLPSLPTICFVPPNSIHGWHREFENLLDLSHPVMKDLQLSIMHNDFKRNEAYYHSSSRVQETMAKAIECHINQQNGLPDCYLKGRQGLSNWFLLVSSSGAQSLYNAYDDKTVNYRSRRGGKDGQHGKEHEGKIFITNGLAASFVFFDEAHTYRGSLSSPTQPFVILKTITYKSWEPTIAFAVSGSISGSGPSQLTNIVDHILRVKDEQEEGEPSIGGITSAAELEGKRSDWSYLLQNSHIISNPKTRAEVKKRKESMGKVMKSLVPHILMARRNVDKFRGHPIGDDGREIVVKQIRCDMANGSGRDAFCKLTANVRAYVSRALDERHNIWMLGGKKGPEPTQRSVEREFFGSQTDSTTAMKLGKDGNHSWTQLLRANVYPEVASLYLNKSVSEEDLDSNSINRHGDEARSLAATSVNRQEVLSQLSASPLWPYRSQLIKQSSKFAKLREYVDEMVAYKGRDPEIHDPGPADGSKVRHMVVFTDSPVSSFVTFMLLYIKYPDVKVMLINGRTRSVATKSMPGYGRREMVDDLMSDCTDSSPNKILVTTYRICGTALNMQRANYCVLMEPARDAKEEAQAAARVNRRGQSMKPITVRFYDERNLPETLRRARHQNQGDMDAWQEEGIRWDDFLQ